MKQHYDFKIEKIKDLSQDEIGREKIQTLTKVDSNKKEQRLNLFKLYLCDTIVLQTMHHYLKEKILKKNNEFEHNFISLSNNKIISLQIFLVKKRNKVLIQNLNYKNEKILIKRNSLNF